MYKQASEGGGNGHFFLALDIVRWMPLELWHDRIDALCLALVASGSPGAVRIPGDLRWAEYRRSLAEGILVEDLTLTRIEALARELAVELGWAENVG
jgi:LDH2 family malate/lactate/ureidoglycolate dehydrogenase